MDRSDASTARSGGAARIEDRTVRRTTPRLKPQSSPSSLAALTVALLACISTAVIGNAPAALSATRSVSHHAHGETGPSGSALSLLAPPGFVTYNQPLLLRFGLPRAVSRQSVSLEIGVYECLGSRSAFDQTLNGNIDVPLEQSSGPIAASSLPSDPQDPAGGVDLSVSVRAGAQTIGGGPFAADLVCTQSYYGVYPLEVRLVQNGSANVVGEMTTYLVYTPYTSASANPQPLRVALVVPFSEGSGTTSDSGTPTAPSATALSRLEDLLQAIAASRVPVTLTPSPATVSALAALQGRSKQASAALAALESISSGAASSTPSVPPAEGSPTGRQVLCGPFADVDASELASAGLSSELSYQLREGDAVLTRVLHLSCQGSDSWVAQSPLDQKALEALSALGYQRAVVPQSGLGSSSFPGTPSRLFDLVNEHSVSLEAATIDPGLSSRLSDPEPSDPALSAQQFVAELEQTYFEFPNASARGVVAVAPQNWGSDPSFVADVLESLDANPMIRPVTLGDLFAQVEMGGYVSGYAQPDTRRAPATAGAGTLPARSIRSARAELQSFSAAVSSGSASGALVVQALDELLLASESSTSSGREQRRAVAQLQAELARQLHSLTVVSSGIRLASNAALVPITLVKTTTYPVTGVLEVTSDKLLFPQTGQSPGSFCGPPVVHSTPEGSSFSSSCVISHSTNVIYVDMRTRATGDFRFSVTFTSPQGGLLLADADLTVRSSSFSAVSIGLSIAAVAVLLAWWGRTAWRKRRARRSRRPAHARGASQRREHDVMSGATNL